MGDPSLMIMEKEPEAEYVCRYGHEINLLVSIHYM